MASAGQRIFDLVGEEPISAMEIHRDHGFDATYTMIPRHLKEAYDLGLLHRRWRGNARFGCWEYWRTQP